MPKLTPRVANRGGVFRYCRLILALSCMFGLAPTAASAQAIDAPGEPVPASEETVSPTAAEPAEADADWGGIEEILVTAQKREESIQSVPIAITAMGAADLEALGITSVGDLATSAVPGLTVLPFAGSPSALSLNMRGISTPDPTVGLVDAGVAIYSDGIPLARAVGVGLELADLERIEVLRGPQGTLFGRNAEGGAIQYVSKKPSGQFSGRVEGTLGNYDLRRVLAHVDLPEFSGVSIKLSGLTTRRDGYVENKPTGPGETLSHHEDLGLEEQTGARLAVLWQPTDSFNAYYTLYHAEGDFTNGFTQRTGGRTPSELGFCSPSSPFAPNCANPAYIAANVYTNTQLPQSGRVDQTPVPLFVKRNTDKVEGHALTLTWAVAEDLQFKSLTGYRQTDTLLDNNLGTTIAFVQFLPTSAFDGQGGDDVPAGTTGAVGGPYAAGLIDQHQFSQELQLVGSMERFRYTAGLFYFQEKAQDVRDSLFTLGYVYLGQPGVLVPFAADAFPIGGTPTVTNPSKQAYDAEARSYAAYFQGSYTPQVLDDRLELTGGLRYTHDEKEHTRTIFRGSPDSTRAPDFENDRIDPAVTLSFNFTEQLHSYLRYATAYRAGGVWLRNKAALTTYEPEEVTSWELGFKSQAFEHRLRYNVAAYYSEVDAYQASIQNLAGDSSSTDIINIDGQKFTGIENELIWAPTEALRASLSYTYQHADAPSQIKDPNGQLIGFRPTSIPKQQFSAAIDWRVPLAGMELVPHLDYAYQSDYDLSPGLPAFTSTAPSSLSVLNARLTLQGIRLGGNMLSIAAWGRNLADNDDYTFTFPAPTSDFTVSPPGGAANLLAPRTYGVDLRYEF